MKHKPYHVITEGSLPNVISDLFDETPLTQKKISERSGIHYRTLSEYKYGGSMPTLRCLLYVLEVLGKALVVVDKDEAPTVAHGWWRWGYNSMNQYGAWCSECECGWEDNGKDDDFIRVQGLVIAHKYCPNCGVKMEGSGNG